MKKLFLLLFFVITTILSTQAQDKKFTIGLGGGASFVGQKVGDVKLKGTGFNYLFNFYYNVNSQISVGAEWAGAGAILKPEEDMGLSFTATGISATSLKGKYHFGESKVRPHVGLGIGYYSVLPGGIEGFDDVASKSTIGFAPEAGLNLGFFQLAAVYHIIPSLDFGGEEKVNYSNFEVRAIFNINFVSR